MVWREAGVSMRYGGGGGADTRQRGRRGLPIFKYLSTAETRPKRSPRYLDVFKPRLKKPS